MRMLYTLPRYNVYIGHASSNMYNFDNMNEGADYEVVNIIS